MPERQRPRLAQYQGRTWRSSYTDGATSRNMIKHLKAAIKWYLISKLLVLANLFSALAFFWFRRGFVAKIKCRSEGEMFCEKCALFLLLKLFVNVFNIDALIMHTVRSNTYTIGSNDRKNTYCGRNKVIFFQTRKNVCILHFEASNAIFWDMEIYITLITSA